MGGIGVPSRSNPFSLIQESEILLADEPFNNLDPKLILLIKNLLLTYENKNKLQYPLLCDIDNSLRNTFNVPKVLGFMDGRVTYIVDRNGMVKHIFRDLLNGPQHIKEAIRVLKEIQN